MRNGFLAATILLGLGLSPLTVTTSAAQEPPNPDVAIVSNTANVRHAKVGQVVIFTIVATFSGPDVPTELFVNTDPENPNLAPAPILCNHFGECGNDMICDRSLPLPAPTADTPSCEFTEAHMGELFTVKRAAFVVQAPSGKYASLTACGELPDYPRGSDPNPTNDCATASVKIVGKRR